MNRRNHNSPFHTAQFLPSILKFLSLTCYMFFILKSTLNLTWSQQRHTDEEVKRESKGLINTGNHWGPQLYGTHDKTQHVTELICYPFPVNHYTHTHIPIKCESMVWTGDRINNWNSGKWTIESCVNEHYRLTLHSLYLTNHFTS